MSSSSQDSPLRDLYLRVEPASDLGITTVVSRCLETEHFDVYPDNSWNKAFQNAVSKIGPTVAIKARTSAVQAVLDDAGYGARQIVLSDGVVPIISSVTSLPDASTSSSLSAALIREEVALVVWAESSEAALAAYNDLEHRLRHKARLCHCGRQPGSSISRGGSFGLLLPAFDVDRFDLSGLGDGLAPLEDFDTLHNIEGGQSLAEEFLYNTSDGYSVELAEPSFSTSDMSMSQSPASFSSDQSSPYTEASPSSTIWSSSSAASRKLTSPFIGFASDQAILSTMSESQNMAVSPMLTISPSLTISPTLTNTSGSPVHGEATPYYTPPTHLEDIDVDEDADGESDDESDDSVDFNMDADGESDDEQSSDTDASATHAATLQLLPTPSAPTEVERPASSQPTPLRKRRGRPARSSSAPLPPTLRLIKPATANLHPLPGRPAVASSSRRHSMSSPTMHEESPARTHGSLSEARMVGQKSKRSQFEEDISGLDADDVDADDEYVDDGITCSDDDDFEDQLADDDDDEYVDDEVSAPPAKRARCSPSTSTSTSTATRPRKTRGRRRTSSKAKKATCPECKQTFVRRTDLTRHQKSSSCARVDVWFACDHGQCPSRFRRKDALKRHVLSVHR